MAYQYYKFIWDLTNYSLIVKQKIVSAPKKWDFFKGSRRKITVSKLMILQLKKVSKISSFTALYRETKILYIEIIEFFQNRKSRFFFGKPFNILFKKLDYSGIIC